MANLTSEQRRRPDELADQLARDNPRLARALAGRWYPLRRTPRPSRGWRCPGLGWLAVLLLLAAVPLLILGVLVNQPVLIALGASATVSGPMLHIAASLRRRPAG